MLSDRQKAEGVLQGQKPTPMEDALLEEISKLKSEISDLLLTRRNQARSINGLLRIIAGIVPHVPQPERLIHGIALLNITKVQLEFLNSDDDLRDLIGDLAKITRFDLNLSGE